MTAESISPAMWRSAQVSKTWKQFPGIALALILFAVAAYAYCVALHTPDVTKVLASFSGQSLYALIGISVFILAALIFGATVEHGIIARMEDAQVLQCIARERAIAQAIADDQAFRIEARAAAERKKASDLAAKRTAAAAKKKKK